MDRNDHLNQLTQQHFDLIVIGGGISGGCLAYDAAKRGLSVALLEKHDFGGATSASSSGVLHGGIRYLQQGRLDKVRESAFERVYFQNLVPHLCHYVPFLIPSYRALSKGRLALRAALAAYAAACIGQHAATRAAGHSVPRARMLSAREFRDMIPLLEENVDVTGGALLPECHMKSSERVTLALIDGAVEHGAVVTNYTVAEAMRDIGGSVKQLIVRDTETDTELDVRGTIVANCSGPWIGTLNERLIGEAKGPVTGYSRGAHIVVDGLDISYALALPTDQKIEGLADRGGRHMFLIPWRGRTLIGTSYAAHDDSLDRVAPLEADIEQLISGINQALGLDLISRDGVTFSYAGIYPLTTDQLDASVYQGTGDYSIIDHYKKDGISGYLSVFGAKYTTARLLAEKACDLIIRRLSRRYAPCGTRFEPVPTADFGDPADFVSGLESSFGQTVARETIDKTVENYGARAPDVLRLVQERSDLGRPLHPDRDTIGAEAVFSARHEMVCHLDDFVFRRTGLGTIGDPGRDVILRCADLVGDELSWSPEHRREEIARVQARFDAFAPDGKFGVGG